MKYAIVENGIVTNIALADAPVDQTWVVASDTAEIGGSWNGKKFSPAPPDRSAERAAAIAYLAATDWMVVRSVEEGVPLDPDVKAQRAEARKKASDETVKRKTR